MPTQTEIDAAAERLRLPWMEAYSERPSFGYPAQMDADRTSVVNAYLSLTDPTPITPEGLEAEWLTGKVHFSGLNGWYVSNASLPHIIPVKTMGGVRLAMMQARESAK